MIIKEKEILNLLDVRRCYIYNNLESMNQKIKGLIQIIEENTQKLNLEEEDISSKQKQLQDVRKYYEELTESSK